MMMTVIRKTVKEEIKKTKCVCLNNKKVLIFENISKESDTFYENMFHADHNTVMKKHSSSYIGTLTKNLYIG